MLCYDFVQAQFFIWKYITAQNTVLAYDWWLLWFPALKVKAERKIEAL